MYMHVFILNAGLTLKTLSKQTNKQTLPFLCHVILSLKVSFDNMTLPLKVLILQILLIFTGKCLY